MILVWFAVFPAMFWGMYNVGLQTIPALHKLYGAEHLQQVIANNWHYSVAQWLGELQRRCRVAQHDDAGGGIFPAYLPDRIHRRRFWEVLFAIVRKHEINEGFFVTSILFALIVPPTMPLWQAALGISFGVVIAKEISAAPGAISQPGAGGARVSVLCLPGADFWRPVWTAADGFPARRRSPSGPAAAVKRWLTSPPASR